MVSAEMPGMWASLLSRPAALSVAMLPVAALQAVVSAAPPRVLLAVVGRAALAVVALPVVAALPPAATMMTVEATLLPALLQGVFWQRLGPACSSYLLRP